MKEIEVKARIASVNRMRDILSERGAVITKAIRQYDTVYLQRGVMLDTYSSDDHALRIRRTDGEAVYTLKKQAGAEHLSKIELETRISDPDELHLMLEVMGYVIVSDLTKDRLEGKLRDLTFCLDHVEGLGDFIELEKMIADDVVFDEGAVRADLWRALSDLGISRDDEITVGYDVLDHQRRQSVVTG